MQTGEDVYLVKATTGETLEMMGHACLVRLATQNGAIGIADKLVSVKPQKVVYVIVVLLLPVTVGLSSDGCRWSRWRRLFVFRVVPSGDRSADLVHQPLHIQIGLIVVEHGLADCSAENIDLSSRPRKDCGGLSV